MSEQDMETAQGALLWARRERLILTRVKVGDVELDVGADLALVPTTPPTMGDRPTMDPYAQFGGAALERARRDAETEESGGSAVVDEDD